jgi:hypothetical protein
MAVNPTVPAKTVRRKDHRKRPALNGALGAVCAPASRALNLAAKSDTKRRPSSSNRHGNPRLLPIGLRCQAIDNFTLGARAGIGHFGPGKCLADGIHQFAAHRTPRRMCCRLPSGFLLIVPRPPLRLPRGSSASTSHVGPCSCGCGEHILCHSSMLNGLGAST